VTLRQEFTQTKRELPIWKTEVKKSLRAQPDKRDGMKNNFNKNSGIKWGGQQENIFQIENDQEFSRN